MNHPISKRADFKEHVDKYIKTVWRDGDGFFENLFRVGTYLSPFLGIGWLPLILSALGSSLLGIGVSDLGKWIDNKLGIAPGETPPKDWSLQIEKEIEFLTRGARAAAIMSQRQMTKEAGIFSAIFKSGKIAGLIVKGIGKFIAALFGIYAVASLDDLIRAMSKPVREKVKEVAPEYIPDDIVEKSDKPTVENITKYLEQKYEL